MIGFQYPTDISQLFQQQNPLPLLKNLPYTFGNAGSYPLSQGGVGYTLPSSYDNFSTPTFDRMLARRKQNERTNRFQPTMREGFSGIIPSRYNNQIEALGPQATTRPRPYSF